MLLLGLGAEMTTIYVGTLTHTECYKCGIVFGIPDEYHQGLKDYGANFWCPVGHSQRYSETEVQRLRKRVEKAERATTSAERAEIRECAAHDQTRTDLQRTEAQRRGEKAAKTRMKNRIAKGVCPCCNRYFQFLDLHMEKKHPEFVQEDD